MTFRTRKSSLKATLFGVVIAAISAAGSANAAPTVSVTVLGVKAQQGFVMIALYDEKGWTGASLARIKTPARGDTVTAVLAAPVPGRYGIKMFQDLNSNGELDTNIVGIPTEPIGFSNDAPVHFGPPEFAAAAFDIGASGAVQTITLN